MESLQLPSPELSLPNLPIIPERLNDRNARAEYIKKLSLKLNDFSPITEKPLNPVLMTKQAWAEDEVRFFIAYGPHGYGKSTYSAQCLAQLHGTWDPEVLKRFLVWKPEMLGDIIESVEDSGKEEMLLVCDDAGVWINALEWNDPLLARLGEYFDVIRMHFHAVMFTSPLPMHVIKRIRGLPSCLNIRIEKVNRNLNKPRRAKGYSQYLLPDLKRTSVHPEFIDEFFAIMPEKFYRWYKPARRGFTREAWLRVRSELEKLKKKNEPQTVA